MGSRVFFFEIMSQKLQPMFFVEFQFNKPPRHQVLYQEGMKWEYEYPKLKTLGLCDGLVVKEFAV